MSDTPDELPAEPDPDAPEIESTEDEGEAGDD